jgi:hypothetical protein
LLEYGCVKLMVDPQILALCNPSFDPLKLKAGQKGKENDETEKKYNGVKRSEKCLLGRLIGEINEKDEDKIYEISEHG